MLQQDTILFSQFYDEVTGIDSSSEAIKLNNKKLKESKNYLFYSMIYPI